MFRFNRKADFLNKKSIRFYFFCTLFTVSITVIISNSAYSGNLLRAPQNPLKATSEVQSENKERSPNIFNKISSAPIIFYQRFLSQHWGHRCSHHPSCSRYSLLAIKKHGAIIGFIMTFDRLQHESNEAKYSPLIKIGDETKVYDPVKNNDFWWNKR